jgi:hypothetical protein
VRRSNERFIKKNDKGGGIRMYFTLFGRIVAAGMLIWALDNHPYGYFTLLRIIVCCVAAYCAVLANEQKKNSWTWTLAVVAVFQSHHANLSTSRNMGGD